MVELHVRGHYLRFFLRRIIPLQRYMPTSFDSVRKMKQNGVLVAIADCWCKIIRIRKSDFFLYSYFQRNEKNVANQKRKFRFELSFFFIRGKLIPQTVTSHRIKISQLFIAANTVECLEPMCSALHAKKTRPRKKIINSSKGLLLTPYPGGRMYRLYLHANTRGLI